MALFDSVFLACALTTAASTTPTGCTQTTPRAPGNAKGIIAVHQNGGARNMCRRARHHGQRQQQESSGWCHRARTVPHPTPVDHAARSLCTARPSPFPRWQSLVVPSLLLLLRLITVLTPLLHPAPAISVGSDSVHAHYTMPLPLQRAVGWIIMAEAATPVWTDSVCGAMLTDPTVFYKLTSCFVEGSPIVVTNAAGLFLDGGSFSRVSFVSPSINGFVFSIASSAFTATSTGPRFLLPTSTTNWEIEITSSTISSSSYAVFLFRGTLSSTTISMVSSTIQSIAQTISVVGPVSNVGIDIASGSTILSEGTSFKFMGAVKNFSLSVSDAAMWESSSLLDPLVLFSSTLNGFTANFTGTGSDTVIRASKQHFCAASSAVNVSIVSDGALLVHSFLEGYTNVSYGSDAYYGLLYVRNGSTASTAVSVSAISISISNADSYDLVAVVRVESPSAVIQNVDLTVMHIPAVGRDIFMTYVYAHSTDIDGITLRTKSASMFCMFACLNLGSVTNLVVEAQDLFGDSYLGYVIADRIEHATMTFAVNDGSGEFCADTMVTAFVALSNVSISVAGGTGASYVLFGIDGDDEHPPFYGLVSTVEAAMVRDLTVRVTDVWVLDEMFGDDVGTMLNLDAATISGVSFLMTDSLVDVDHGAAASHMVALSSSSGMSAAVAIDVLIRITRVDVHNSLGTVVFASIDPSASSNMQVELDSLSFTSSWNTNMALISVPACNGALLTIDNSEFVMTGASNRHHRLINVGTSGQTSSNTVVSCMNVSLECNDPCSFLSYEGIFQQASVIVERSSLLMGTTSSGTGLVFVSASYERPGTQRAARLHESTLKLVDITFESGSSFGQLVKMHSLTTFQNSDVYIGCISGPSAIMNPIFEVASGSLISRTSFTVINTQWRTPYEPPVALLSLGDNDVDDLTFRFVNLLISADRIFGPTSITGDSVITFGCVTFNGALLTSAGIAASIDGVSAVETACVPDTCETAVIRSNTTSSTRSEQTLTTTASPPPTASLTPSPSPFSVSANLSTTTPTLYSITTSRTNTTLRSCTSTATKSTHLLNSSFSPTATFTTRPSSASGTATKTLLTSSSSYSSLSWTFTNTITRTLPTATSLPSSSMTQTPTTSATNNTKKTESVQWSKTHTPTNTRPSASQTLTLTVPTISPSSGGIASTTCTATHTPTQTAASPSATISVGASRTASVRTRSISYTAWRPRTGTQTTNVATLSPSYSASPTAAPSTTGSLTATLALSTRSAIASPSSTALQTATPSTSHVWTASASMSFSSGASRSTSSTGGTLTNTTHVNSTDTPQLTTQSVTATLATASHSGAASRTTSPSAASTRPTGTRSVSAQSPSPTPTGTRTRASSSRTGSALIITVSVSPSPTRSRTASVTVSWTSRQSPSRNQSSVSGSPTASSASLCSLSATASRSTETPSLSRPYTVSAAATRSRSTSVKASGSLITASASSSQRSRSRTASGTSPSGSRSATRSSTRSASRSASSASLTASRTSSPASLSIAASATRHRQRHRASRSDSDLLPSATASPSVVVPPTPPPSTPLPAAAKAGAVALTTATAATAVLSASAIGTATMQAALSQASCRRGSSSEPPPSTDDNPALYLISPFFGDSALMVGGNISIAIAALLLHAVVAAVARAVLRRAPATEQKLIVVEGAPTLDEAQHQDRPDHPSKAAGGAAPPPAASNSYADAFTAVRFPNLSISFAHACVQGVQLGSWQLLWDALNGRSAKYARFGSDGHVASHPAGCALLGVLGIALSVVPTLVTVKLRSFLLRAGGGDSADDDCLLPPPSHSAVVTVQSGNELPASRPEPAADPIKAADDGADGTTQAASCTETEAAVIEKPGCREQRGSVSAAIASLLGIDAAIRLIPLQLSPDASCVWVALLRHAGPKLVWSPPAYLRRFSCVFNAFSAVPILGPWLLAEQWVVSLLVTLVSAADPTSNHFWMCNGLMIVCAAVLVVHLVAVLWLKPFRLPLKNPLKAVCISLLAFGCLLSAPMVGESEVVSSAQSANDLVQSFTVMTLGVYEMLIFVALERSRTEADSSAAPAPPLDTASAGCVEGEERGPCEEEQELVTLQQLVRDRSDDESGDANGLLAVGTVEQPVAHVNRQSDDALDDGSSSGRVYTRRPPAPSRPSPADAPTSVSAASATRPPPRQYPAPPMPVNGPAMRSDPPAVAHRQSVPTAGPPLHKAPSFQRPARGVNPPLRTSASSTTNRDFSSSDDDHPPPRRDHHDFSSDDDDL